MKKQLRYDFIMRLLIEVFLELSITVFIQSRRLDFSNFTGVFGTVLAMIFLFFVASMPMAVVLLLAIN